MPRKISFPVFALMLLCSCRTAALSTDEHHRYLVSLVLSKNFSFYGRAMQALNSLAVPERLECREEKINWLDIVVIEAAYGQLNTKQQTEIAAALNKCEGIMNISFSTE